MTDAHPAARGQDFIAHSLELCGLIAGALVGAVVGALLIGAAVATGGAALIAIAVVAGIGAVGMGGLSGGQLARGLQTVFQLPDPETGILNPSASPDVWIGGRRSARAGADAAAWCHGLWTYAHPFCATMMIAEGSKTVIVNDSPVARVASKLVCGAAIASGDDTVIIGGPTVRVLPVLDMEDVLAEIFEWMSLLSVAGLVILAPETLPVLAGFMALSELLGELGDAIGPGWRDVLQGTLGLAALAAGRSWLVPDKPAWRNWREILRMGIVLHRNRWPKPKLHMDWKLPAGYPALCSARPTHVPISSMGMVSLGM
jgi:uncharacterized Zn-binding protein involved in type VI secretion